MFIPPLASALFFYSFFLLSCGIASVLLIGSKAKTALISGGTAGSLIALMAALLTCGWRQAAYGAWGLTTALFFVFCWRSAKTLFRLLELAQSNDPQVRGKSIAFMIISLMAIVSLVMLLLQTVVAFS